MTKTEFEEQVAAAQAVRDETATLERQLEALERDRAAKLELADRVHEDLVRATVDDRLAGRVEASKRIQALRQEEAAARAEAEILAEAKAEIERRLDARFEVMGEAEEALQRVCATHWNDRMLACKAEVEAAAGRFLATVSKVAPFLALGRRLNADYDRWNGAVFGGYADVDLGALFAAAKPDPKAEAEARAEFQAAATVLADLTRSRQDYSNRAVRRRDEAYAEEERQRARRRVGLEDERPVPIANAERG